MNYIKAVISNIQSVDNITIVSFQTQGQNLKMMALALDDTLQEGTKVVLGAKATNISLAKDLNGLLSISNQLPCKITHINQGKLLCSVKFDCLDSTLESIITKDSAIRMKLKEGDAIIALIKSSELSIVEVV